MPLRIPLRPKLQLIQKPTITIIPNLKPTRTPPSITIKTSNRNYINEPKFDDADIIARGLNQTAYKPKRRPTETQGNTTEPSNQRVDKSVNGDSYLEAETEKVVREVTLRRMRYIRYGSWGVLVGVALLGASSLFVGGDDRYDMISKWVFTSEEKQVSDDKESDERSVPSSSLPLPLPIVSKDEPGFDTPGLYFVGNCDLDSDEGKTKSKSKNNRRGDPWFGVPRRIPIFDGMTLRDVCLVDAGTNLVVDANGDLFNWDRRNTTTTTRATLTPVLKGERVVQVKESNGCAYALTEAGEILIVPLDSLDSAETFRLNEGRTSLFPRLFGWNAKHPYRYKLNVDKVFDQKLGETKIESFDTGDRHLVLISNSQRVFSCATGDPRAGSAGNGDGDDDDDTPKSKGENTSRGQFGVPALSQFHEYPKPNELYEVELLNKWVSSSSSVTKGTPLNVNIRKFSKVACGDYHTVALDTDGHLFTFGWNRYGQLGLAISYANEVVPYPKQISMYGFIPFFNVDTRDTDTGDATMINDSKNLKLKCIDVHSCRETTYVTIQNELGSVKYFALGNGMFGELGNGTIKNSQFKPTQIKFSEIGNLVTKWGCNKDSRHVVCTLDNGGVESWGLNSNGQLANWEKRKLQKINKPAVIPQLLEPGVNYNEEADRLLELKNLVLDAEKQRVAVGKDGTCIYWTKK